MGRPKGSLNNTSFLMPWRPLTWKPVYDTMVALKCAGYNNVEIAEATEYTATQVGNILRTPEAKRRLTDFSTNFSAAQDDELQTRLNRIRQKSVERIESLIMDDERAEAAPMQVATFAVSLLKGLGTLNGDSSVKSETNNTLVMSDAIAEKLFKGLEMSTQVRKLHA